MGRGGGSAGCDGEGVGDVEAGSRGGEVLCFREAIRRATS